MIPKTDYYYLYEIVILGNFKNRSFLGSASRRCSDDGLWIDYEGNESLDVGWTNFTSCFPPDIWTIIEKEGNKTGVLI